MKKVLVVSFILIFTLSSFALCLAKSEKDEGPAEEAELTITPGTKINVFVDGGINVFPFELFKDKVAPHRIDMGNGGIEIEPAVRGCIRRIGVIISVKTK